MSGPSNWCPLTENFPLSVRLSPLSSYHTSVISLKEPTGKSSDKKFKLTLDTVNEHLRKMEYAVRGLIPSKAAEIEKAMKNGDKSFPFDRVLYCNIGDCHAMGQKPITFIRQLLAVCTNPDDLMESGLYPSDVVERAKDILSHCRGYSIGSYSDSRGIMVIREHVAEFLSQRDGHPCSREHVFLVNGASDGIKQMLYVAQGNETRTGVMIPQPQYPLYTAAITELDAEPIFYFLNEEKGWGIDIDCLRPSLNKAKKVCEPRVMVVINPGNPTGSHLPKENIEEIIKFCHEEGLVLFTDQVYQENIHQKGVKFYSFRKVLLDMPSEYHDLQMVSFNSTSKGFLGECGIRGGYMHLMGMDKDVIEQVYKHTTIGLCPNTPGQVATDALVKRPQPGDPSYELYQQEFLEITQSLERKANMVYTRLNEIPGVSCNDVLGAMYAFPKVEIPEEAWADCRAVSPDLTLDAYYCLEFLKQKGVCVVPGSGFGQKEGTWHFRTTILPSADDLEHMLDSFKDFHLNFLRKYGRNV